MVTHFKELSDGHSKSRFDRKVVFRDGRPGLGRQGKLDSPYRAINH